MKVKPLANRLVIQKGEEITKTKTGIIIPDNHAEKPLQGKVISVGPEVKELAENDEVIFGKYSGTEVVVEGNSYLILKEEEVLAKLQ